jgi:mevalonate kinase
MNLFPAKLLLFGEYSILLASSAVSIPLNYFGASLKFIGDESGGSLAAAMESNLQLKSMCTHFLANAAVFEGFLDLSRLSKDISEGLFLESTIPQRYGMGSSGALCAAVFEGYEKTGIGRLLPDGMDDIVARRKRLSQMESFFHGRSSGFDPLVSFLKKPLLLDTAGAVRIVDYQSEWMHENGLAMMLVDSGQPAGTGPLVADFLAHYAPEGKITKAGTTYVNMVNSAVEWLREGDVVALYDEITRLSRFQLTNFHHLVPEALRPVWAEGLQTGMFALKLCGSGGGGFLLCFTRSNEMTVEYFTRRNFPVIQQFKKTVGPL